MSPQLQVVEQVKLWLPETVAVRFLHCFQVENNQMRLLFTNDKLKTLVVDIPKHLWLTEEGAAYICMMVR